MKILVTGSGGLVGKKIAELLVNQKHSVVNFDHNSGFDILDPQAITAAMKECDAVIHCAALLNENRGKDLLWKTNVDGTKNILAACVQNKVKRLVFLSSVGVYGTVPGIKNENSPLSPKTLYDQSKVAGEKFILENRSVGYTIIRSALVVGPSPHWKKLFSFVKKGFPLVGDGRQTWQTVDYEDLAKAAVFLLFSKEGQNGVFIVAGSEKPSLIEFTGFIRESMGKKTRVMTVPLWIGKIAGFFGGFLFWVLQKPNPLSPVSLEGMLQERRYDISKIEKAGWKNGFSFRESIQKTVAELKMKNSR
ncbi:MAG: NAD(P)-dependent oxidoreductase [Candidatus Micrarchaeota archaeon]